MIYRGTVSDSRLRWGHFGIRSGFVVLEIRTGVIKDVLPPSSGVWYPVWGLLLKIPRFHWMKVHDIHDARVRMYEADEQNYADEFKRITSGN